MENVFSNLSRMIEQVGKDKGIDRDLIIDAVKQDESPQIYGGGEQIRCFCHVKDAADGAVASAESPRAGAG